MFDERIFQVFAGAAAGVAGLFTLWKLVGKPAFVAAKRATDLVKNASEILRVLRAIEKDFRPNGGSSFRDAITRVEERVTMIDERQKALLNLSAEGVFEADPAGLLTYSNRQFSEITGLYAAEARDNGWIVGLHPEDRQRVVTEWRHAVADRRDFVSRFRFVHPGGGVARVVCHASAMKRPGGEVVGYIGTVRQEAHGGAVDP